VHRARLNLTLLPKCHKQFCDWTERSLLETSFRQFTEINTTLFGDKRPYLNINSRCLNERYPDIYRQLTVGPQGSISQCKCLRFLTA
jgi:hypothetical protein